MPARRGASIGAGATGRGATGAGACVAGGVVVGAVVGAAVDGAVVAGACVAGGVVCSDVPCRGVACSGVVGAMGVPGAAIGAGGNGPGELVFVTELSRMRMPPPGRTGTPVERGSMRTATVFGGSFCASPRVRT